MRAFGWSIPLSIALLACGMADPAPSGQGPQRGAPGAIARPNGAQPPGKSLPRSKGAPSFFATPGAPPLANTTPAAASDGGLSNDGGARVESDQELAVAVESQGRPLSACFPPSLPTLPDVSIDFQISVSGRVTRAEVSGPGLDHGIEECVRRAAETVRFPDQQSVRGYRYALKLRRVDAGTPSPTKAPAPSSP